MLSVNFGAPTDFLVSYFVNLMTLKRFLNKCPWPSTCYNLVIDMIGMRQI